MSLVHSLIQQCLLKTSAMYTAISLKKHSLNNSLTWPLTKAKDITFNSIRQNTFYQKTKVLAKIYCILVM